MVERPYFGVWNGLISGVSSLHLRLFYFLIAGGVKRISGMVYDESRKSYMNGFWKNVFEFFIF